MRGDIKIFDFGLAKELKPCDKVGPDQFHTSGIAGTRRYMAPEVRYVHVFPKLSFTSTVQELTYSKVAQVIPYGLSADVCKFSSLFLV